MKLKFALVALAGVFGMVVQASVTHAVSTAPGYNSWPMMKAVRGRLVCAYSRGAAHEVVERVRGVYARTSADGARWSDEVTVVNDPTCGNNALGSGLDEDGNFLLWVGNYVGGFGDARNTFALYRSKDGTAFEKIAEPKLPVSPIQIMDVVRVPGVGLQSLWFAGNYHAKGGMSWGTLTSADNGKTWEMRTVESGLPKTDWPTEQSVVVLPDGRLLGLARAENAAGSRPRLMQLTSTDAGRTWKRAFTAIDDVLESTPSLLLDAATGDVCVYYYQRGAKLLKRRTAEAGRVFADPLAWSAPEVIAQGNERRAYDAGNVKAARLGEKDFVAWYSGSETDTTVLVTTVPR